MNNKPKLVIFDLDGTLNQAHLYSVPAHLKALKEIGAADGVTEDDIISLIGYGWSEHIKKFVPDCDSAINFKYSNRVTELNRNFIRKSHATYEGIAEALMKLKQKGYIIAVCSNNSLDYINHILRTLDLYDYFDYTRPVVDGKPKVDSLRILLDRIDTDRVVMIGSRKFDLDAAKELSIPFIGCLYGYAPNEVKEADVCISSGSELFDAVEKLI